LQEQKTVKKFLDHQQLSRKQLKNNDDNNSYPQPG
jgi:hypothetical protein